MHPRTPQAQRRPHSLTRARPRSDRARASAPPPAARKPFTPFGQLRLSWLPSPGPAGGRQGNGG
eukprot:7683791-Lingulodinium_polyedra.AAC.1